MRKAIVSILFVVACGPSDDPPFNGDPRLIAGGGVADGPVDGILHVHVIATKTGNPLSGANVHVGSTMAVTDSAGLASFSDVSGPQTVTATAPGHAAATWFGVSGANVTVPLELQAQLPSARVTGTIAGWSSIPAPSLGHYTLAVALYSFVEDPAAPENSIPQPMSGATPLNTCIRSDANPTTCAWQMNARIGKQIHTAVIVDGDSKLTASDLSDDTYTLIGYAAGEVMDVTAGQQIMGESLAMVTGMQPFSVTFPAAPPGLANVVAIPELSIPDVGRVVFPLPTLTPGSSSTQVIAATGKFAGKYELVALATPSLNASAPFSSSFVHDVSGSATVPAWIAPPSNVAGGAMMSFTGASGAAFHTVRFQRAGTVVWNMSLLDGASSFMIPAITPDPLGTGSITASVNAADVPGFDAKKFDIPAMTRALVRASGAEATFSR